MKLYIRLSENQDTLSDSERWGNFDKRMILKKCWISLINNINVTDELFLYCHNVNENTIKWLQRTSPTAMIQIIKVETVEENFIRPLIDIKKSVSQNENPYEIYGYLEDDYLWDVKSLDKIKDSFKHWKGFIIPNDFPESYKVLNKSNVFLGLDRYWKSTNYITWNFIGTQYIFSKTIDEIISLFDINNLKNINKILERTICVHPMPGVATHCKQNQMTPYVNWDFIWRGINI